MYNSDEDEHINLQQQQLGSSLVLFSFSFPPIKIASVHAYTTAWGNPGLSDHDIPE